MKIRKAGDTSSVFDEIALKMAQMAQPQGAPQPAAGQGMSEDQVIQMNKMLEPATQKLREVLTEKIPRALQNKWKPQDLQTRLYWRDIVGDVAAQFAPNSNPMLAPLQRGLNQILDERAPAVVNEVLQQQQRPGQRQQPQQPPGQMQQQPQPGQQQPQSVQ